MQTSEATTETRSIEIEYELPQPPEKVWKVLTDAKLLAKWLLPNDMKTDVDQNFIFQKSGGGDIECEILASEPNRLLRYSWRTTEFDGDGKPVELDTEVTFVLSET